MENEDNSRTARILYERGNYKNVPPFQDIKLLCSAIGPIDRKYSYLWRINGVVKKTQKNIVEVTLSNDYCGKQQTLNVDLQPISINENFSTVKQTVKEEIGEGDINAVPFKFVPFCSSIMIRDFYFYDEQSKMKLSSSSVINVNYPVLAVAEIAGSNGHILNGYFKVYINGRPKKTLATNLPLVDKNRMVFSIWFTPYEIPVGSVAKIEVELFIFLPYQRITRKLQLNVKNDFTYDPNDIKGEVQPVLVGNNSIRESNYKPCKYTGINVKYPSKDKDGKKVTKELEVFNESKNCQYSGIVNIIGGKCPIVIMLIGKETVSCILSENINHDKHLMSIIEFDSEKTSQNAQLIGSIIQWNLKYNYGDTVISLIGKVFDGNISEIAMNSLYSYIWPIRDSLIQSNQIQLATCRHLKIVNMRLFPDIIWELKIGLKFAKYDAVEGKNQEGRAYEELIKKKQQAGYSKWYTIKYGKTQSEFFLELTCTYDDDSQKFEIGKKIEKNIRDYLGVILKAKKMADDILSYVKGIDAKKAPIEFDIQFPIFDASLKWNLVERQNNKIGINGEFTIKANPLIGGLFTIDLFRCGARTIPLLAFIDKIVNQSYKSKYIDYEGEIRLDLKFDGSLILNLTNVIFKTNPFEISLKKSNMKGRFGVLLIAEIGVGLKVYVIKSKATTKLEANATADAYFSGTITPGVDMKGLFVTPEVAFTGLHATVELSAEFGLETGMINMNKKEKIKPDEFEIIPPSKPLKFSPQYIIS